MKDAYATSVIWRRMMYFLSPQLDIYESLKKAVKGKRVLEVGFGTGIGTLQYHAYAEYVDAVEIDPDAFNFVRRTLPLQNVRWIVDDISNPSRRYRGYDVVVMIEVLEHIHNQDKTLRVLKDAVNKQGVAIISVPNANRYRRRQESLNVREYNPYSIKEKVKEVFGRSILLDANLMAVEDYETKESPIIAAGFKV
jgi:2-polyprenyl-3-methyl-5-hydroxy-6-metoxy-1,4-benzoquinol methylase